MAARRHRVLAGGQIAVAAAALWAGGSGAGGSVLAETRRPTMWILDNLSTVGGHALTVVGSPRVVDTPIGPAVEFNGRSDGLFVDVNPLAGLEHFTIEVLFQPAADGAEEQRFVHFEESGSGNRALIELRRLPDTSWTLDTFLRYERASLTLVDRTRTHPTGNWHVASLTFDGRTMSHYIDGIREASGTVAFRSLRDGRTSIGVRQNRVSWFKGRIRTIRVTPTALAPADLLRIDAPATGRIMFLWPEGVPGRKPDGGKERLQDGRVYNVHDPTLTYLPPTAGTGNGTAVIVCPGGSYARLAIANEGTGTAKMLAALGVSSFVLKYRLKEYGFPAPLQDVLRAIRLLRSRADEFAIEPDRIGVFGASAGGHVAAMAATLFDAPEGRTRAPLDTTSGRPDFVALLYPVITMKEPFVNRGSRDNLLGKGAPATLVERLSLEAQVTNATPPVFLVHTAEDESVPLENSLMFFSALRAAGGTAELHVYEKGPHGFGMTPGLGPASEWPKRFEEWLMAHGWLTPAEPRK